MNDLPYVMTQGSRVVADNDCYIREHGTVKGLDSNLFGRTLVKVQLDKGYETVFYPYELSEEI
jgi:hypothetical protein